ncbi:MAG: hypothetical protein GQ559_00420 [Desulfobulbaceae bacterium]|nr:hypothetical protein [Desulfobulbaceae bacterium]
MSSPNSGLKTFDADIKIRWLKSELAEHYNIQLATDPDFSTLLLEQQTKDAFFTTAALNPGSYFFKVQMVAEDGFETSFSQPLTWKVVEQPKLDSMDPTVQGEDGIRLQWPAMADMSGYMLQVANDKKFTDLIVSEEKLTEPSYTITDLLPCGDYYVRMCAIMDDGRTSPWTQAQTMTIDAEPLGMKLVYIGLGFIGLILLL